MLTKLIACRLTVAQHKKLVAAAKKKGIKPATLARIAILKGVEKCD